MFKSLYSAATNVITAVGRVALQVLTFPIKLVINVYYILSGNADRDQAQKIKDAIDGASRQIRAAERARSAAEKQAKEAEIVAEKQAKEAKIVAEKQANRISYLGKAVTDANQETTRAVKEARDVAEQQTIMIDELIRAAADAKQKTKVAEEARDLAEAAKATAEEQAKQDKAAYEELTMKVKQIEVAEEAKAAAERAKELKKQNSDPKDGSPTDSAFKLMLAYNPAVAKAIEIARQSQLETTQLETTRRKNLLFSMQLLPQAIEGTRFKVCQQQVIEERKEKEAEKNKAALEAEWQNAKINKAITLAFEYITANYINLRTYGQKVDLIKKINDAKNNLDKKVPQEKSAEGIAAHLTVDVIKSTKCFREHPKTVNDIVQDMQNKEVEQPRYAYT